MKYLKIVFSNGESYDIPATVVAHERATYYANHDEGKEMDEKGDNPAWTKVYNDERKFTLEDDYELIDWAKNNMNWEDVEEYAVIAPLDPDKGINKHKEWTENDIEVVEK